MTTIKILWTGCAKCKLLEANVQEAIQQISIQADIIKVTDITDIMQYNIMSTPWLVIDEKLVSYGKVHDVEDIKSLLQNKKIPSSKTPPCSCSEWCC